MASHTSTTLSSSGAAKSRSVENRQLPEAALAQAGATLEREASVVEEASPSEGLQEVVLGDVEQGGVVGVLALRAVLQDERPGEGETGGHYAFPTTSRSGATSRSTIPYRAECAPRSPSPSVTWTSLAVGRRSINAAAAGSLLPVSRR